MTQAKKKLLYLTSILVIIVAISSTLYGLNIGTSWQEKITDRFFTKHEPQSPIVIVAIDNQSISELGQWPWPRELFAKTLEKISGAKAIGIDINFSEPSRTGTKDDTILAQAFETKQKTTPVILPFQIQERGRIADVPLPQFIPYIHQGYVNVDVDADTIVRSLRSEQNSYTSFSRLLVESSDPKTFTIPASFRINYQGPEGTFLRIPIVDVLNNKVPARVFEKNIVLIGATAENLHDVLNTPFGPMSGIEVHANSVETILTGNFLHPISFPFTLLIIALIDLAALLLIIKINRFSFLLLSLIILICAVNAFGALLFSYTIIFPSLYVTLSFIVISICVILYQYISESQEKKFIRKAFQHYLSKELIDELVKNPGMLVLGGERRRISILFSDIRSFTTISEAMTPEELTAFMGEYFAVVSDIVLEERGILDKYIGDAIMAYWGAPLVNPEHPLDACRVAVKMLSNVDAQNKIWTERGLPIIKIGIGINTGDVVVGNMGSQRRFNYGIVGDEVNFASRLEGLTKEYGVSCIVSESTAKEIAQAKENAKDLVTRELDIVIVKGKKEPKKIFELITKPITETIQKQLELFKSGREKYMSGNWEQAISCFKQTLELGEDGPSKVFLERCEKLKKEPPTTWTGVYEFKTK